MPIIRIENKLITQINVFTVSNEQQALIDYLAHAAKVASEVDGWISASLHRSIDGTRVVNYAQSVDLASAQRIFTHLKERGLIDGNKAYGEAHPGLYEVAFTLDKQA